MTPNRDGTIQLGLYVPDRRVWRMGLDGRLKRYRQAPMPGLSWLPNFSIAFLTLGATTYWQYGW